MSSDAKSINEINADLFQPEEVDRYGDPKESRKKAMDYLARREYGHDELIAKLTKAGYAADVTADVVSVLRDDGLQSDQRFSESFVQSRVNQGKGPVRIRQELAERGIRSGDVSDALENAGADWYAIALEIRRKKFGFDLPADFKEKARQMRFLQYRGFEQDHIQAAIAAHGEP
ncbi:MAG: regulatory protein RecX [Woeseiaceae bacterium]